MSTRHSTGRSERGEEVILVDEHDNPIGFEAKLEAHKHGGKLHRAFSIFVFDGAGRMLLQRRSRKKYHFGGLWTNACCGHPRRGEALLDAARRRLREEFGFDAELEELFTFIYRASDPESGLAENEFDHVLRGEFDGEPRPNPEEIDDWRWIGPAELAVNLQANPRCYTPWFAIAARRGINGLHPPPTSPPS